MHNKYLNDLRFSFFFQAEDGIRYLVRSRGLGDVYKRQMLIYALLHLTGYDLPMSELKNFRQLHSKTAGHPLSLIHI